MADWLDYQKLAASIYQNLERNAVVTHDDKILGHNTGVTRQIDVSIRASLAGHDVLVIVQAKHLKRPADVNVVGEFKGVIDDVRASKGVLICSAGFTKAAMEYGQSLAIDLCSAHDATSRVWSLDLRLPLLWVEPVVDVALEMAVIPNRVNTEPIELSADARFWKVSADAGQTFNTLADLLTAHWNAPDTPHTPEIEHRLELPCDGLTMLFGDSNLFPLANLIFTYTIRHHGWHGSFTFNQCRGIFNRGTGLMRAVARLTDKDIPLQRDPTWQVVGDLKAFVASNPNLIRIEKSAPTPENLVFDRMAFDQ